MIDVFRRLAAVSVALVVFSGAMAPAGAWAAPSASIVMDMRDGKVLQSRSADRRLHPASLTKMMTLYLAFEAVRSGKLNLDQKVRVSRHAARQPASKLYLKTGQRVSIRSLIRATAIKSANDAAMVLAEAIGGSQRGFARMMTETAKRLGMKNSAFRNPHGLTSRGHYSTARDMAILARHLFYDYPEYYNIFKRKTGYAAGKRIWTTNRLLSAYTGAEGMKTGYTRAAGYNLVATALRGKKRVIAVVFGARSSRQRTKKVAKLLDIGFSRAPRSVRTVRPAKAGHVRRGRWVDVKNSPVPQARPGMRASVVAAVAEVLASPAAAATPAAEAAYVATPQPARSAPPRVEMSDPAAARTAVAQPERTGRPASKFAPVTAERPVARGIRIARRGTASGSLLVHVPIPLPRPVRLAAAR